MLFRSPFEEKLHLPAAFVEFGYRQCVQNKVVGEKDQALARFGIDILDPSERNRVFGRCLGAGKHDGLIAAESRGFVDGTVRSAAVLEVLLGTRDVESQVQMKDVESGEIDVTPVHHVAGAGLHGQVVERFDVVHFPAGNVDETREVAAQVDQGMQFDGSLASAESRPREESQTQSDRRRIEGVDGLFQFDAQGVAGIELPGLRDEDAGEIRVNAPIAVLVGLGQRVACDVPANACVI